MTGMKEENGADERAGNSDPDAKTRVGLGRGTPALPGAAAASFLSDRAGPSVVRRY